MGEIIVSLAISAAISAASAGLQYALTPKPKKPSPVDRGKLDDVRFSLPAYGAAIPKGWGTFRVAPIWFWHTPAIDIPLTTPGQQGGKGGGGAPATPDTIEHRYFKNIAGVFHDGLVNKSAARIWFDNEIVYNASLARNMADTSSTRYEAEHGVLAGGASVITQVECSEGKKVIGIGSGGSVTTHVDVTATATYEVSVAYTSTVERTFKISVNGGATVDLVCAASGGAGLVAYKTISLALTNGANTIAFSNAGAAAPDLDSISIAPALVFVGGVDNRSFTGLITPGRIPPTDPDIAWPIGDEIPEFSDTVGGVTAGGFFSATLGKWGNPQIRIYPGSETQPQDPLIVSVMGVLNTSAHRGFGYLVIEGLQLQNGRVPNVTIEIEQGTREAAIIVSDVYAEVGIPATDLDVAALGGLVLGDSTGFNPGSYSAITWLGIVNATAGANGKINKTSGANNTWNAYANNGGTVAAGTDAAIRFTAGAGVFMIGFATTTTPGSTLPNPYNQVPFAVLLNVTSNPSQTARNAIQMSLGGSNNSSDVGVWAVGDSFQVEYRNGRFAAYQNGLLLTGFVPPVPSGFPLIPIVVMYSTGGGPETASYATGANIGTEPIVANGGALILDTQREAGELLEELMTRFQFLLPEVDGKIKAVKLDAVSELTLTHDEIRAHRGDTIAEVEINRANPLTFPKKTIVNYSDPQMDHHANAQVEPRLFGPQKGTLNVTLAMVETADNMKKLAVTLSDRAEVEGQTYRFWTGAKYKRIHQGTVVTLTLPSSSHVVRVTDVKADLPAGIVEFEAVKQSVAFTPNAVGSVGTGTESPVVPIPGNTKGVILDGPLLRAEDAGDGTQPVVYVAMCGRGSGNWPAGFFYKEFPILSGNYILETVATTPSGIGVTAGTLPNVSDATLWDRTSSLVVNFLSNTELQSVTEAELLNSPELNLLALANPSTREVECIQFATATPGVAVAPYITKYTLSTFLRGRIATDANTGTHTAADDVVVIDSTIKPRRLPVTDIGRTLKLKFLTSGQGLDSVAITEQLFRGNSLKPLAPIQVRGTRNAAGDLFITWLRRDRVTLPLRDFAGTPLREERESYIVEVYSGSTLKRQIFSHATPIPVMWIGNEHALINGSSVTHNQVTNGSSAVAQSIQKFSVPEHNEEFIFEATLKEKSNGSSGRIIVSRPGLGRVGYSIIWGSGLVGGIQVFEVERTAVSETDTSVSLVTPYIDNTRLRITRNREGFWFTKISGGLTVPFYRSNFTAEELDTAFNIQYLESFDLPATPGALNDAMMTTVASSCVITAAQQIKDFGSVQSSIKVRIFQQSAIVGPGYYTEITL